MKPANKAEPKSVAAAESVERRAGTKGNATSKARAGRSVGFVLLDECIPDSRHGPDIASSNAGALAAKQATTIIPIEDGRAADRVSSGAFAGAEEGVGKLG
jgi:hypothetical protein